MGAGEKCRCLPSDGSYWLTSYSKKRTAAGAPTDLTPSKAVLRPACGLGGARWSLRYLVVSVERRRVARPCGPCRLGRDTEALEDRARGVRFGYGGGDAESAAAHGAFEDVRVECPTHERGPVDAGRGREERPAKKSVPVSDGEDARCEKSDRRRAWRARLGRGRGWRSMKQHWRRIVARCEQARCSVDRQPVATTRSFRCRHVSAGICARDG